MSPEPNGMSLTFANCSCKTHSMKEETAREFYKLLEHVCALLNEKTRIKVSPDEVMQMGAKIFPGTPRNVLSATAKGAMGLFRSIPEPSKEQKAQLRTVIGDLPFMLRRGLIQLGKESKNLPYKRGKPTPEKLRTAQQKKEACDDVMRYLPLVDNNLEKACKHIGAKYGASSRTIRRLYVEYCKNLKSSAR